MLNDRGVALILTLWILAALIVLAAGLAMMVRTETQISRNYVDVVFCRWAARAGENAAISEVVSLAGESVTFFEDSGMALSSDTEDIDLGESTFEVSIEDEAAKININTASVEMLEALFDSRGVAECIADWRDEDDQPLPEGAETQYYAGSRKPYRCKNGPFETVGELLLVKGVTEDVLSSPVSGSGKVRDFLTVYSRDDNQTAAGNQRVNIQTAGQEQLKSELGDALGDQDIDAIVKHRTQRKFETAAAVALTQGLDRDKVRLIYDRLTVSEQKTLAGLVNVNTASVDVLSALPGMDRQTAEEIVAYRDSDGPYSDVGAVLQVKAVDVTSFAQWADMLTVRSRVFKIISTGRMAASRSSSRITCIADVSDGKNARIRYRQE